ncbi:hypothetical protein [Rhizobium sophoriradicis]|uniref:Phosphoribosyltransferase n=1 Tax=Rhizobium sophoriradicis TaxID=1535245 RepID=A0A2A5KVZ1_9HYPH|nr:hypothetical protein [Rhizobium sophoriradicis]PCK81219.1 hypothetical protein CPT34_11075 [Rhizobium sophoriradicis]
MTLKVHYLCSYYSQWAHNNLAPRTQALWDAFMFSRAVKNRSINGSCVAPTKKPVTITAGNVGKARELFGAFIRQALTDDVIQSSLLVPVPSKDSWNTENFRSLEMLKESLPERFHSCIRPLVRFSEERPKAAEGGERGYDSVRPFLRLASPVPQSPLILVDDILTTGGSMLATRDFLVEKGGAVSCGIVCGKTTSAIELGFKIRECEIEDHVGHLDFF